MKKLLAALAIITTLIEAWVIYPQTMKVIRIEGDDTYIMTSTGYVYIIETDDYDEGDLVSTIMFNNGTPSIEDDIVLRARYCGF